MKITILLCVYNGEKYLPKALECINSQTYKDIEVFLFDHGSEDKTMEIINNFNCKFKCIKRHYDRVPEDYRYTCSRPGNDAFKETSGEFLYWYAADDFITRDFILNNVIQHINNRNMNIWHSPMCLFEIETGKKEALPRMMDYENMADLKNKMIERSLINCPTVFMNVKTILGVGGFNAEYMNCGDYEMWLRLLNNGIYIYPIRKFLGLYYGVNPNQCTVKLQERGDGYPEEILKKRYKDKWKL